MIQVTILDGPPQDPQEFARYYAVTHLPLAAKMKGVDLLELTRFGPDLDGSKPAYYRMAELYFPSEAQLRITLGSPEGQAAVAGLPKFATGGVTMLTGSVESCRITTECRGRGCAPPLMPGVRPAKNRRVRCLNTN